MLLLPRSWASSSLNPQVCSAFCLEPTSVGVFGALDDGAGGSGSTRESVLGPVRLPEPARLLKDGWSCLRRPRFWPLSLWRRCCLATRQPWELSLLLFLLLFFVSFLAAILTRRRFLTQKCIAQIILHETWVNDLKHALMVFTSEEKCAASNRTMILQAFYWQPYPDVRHSNTSWQNKTQV